MLTECNMVEVECPSCSETVDLGSDSSGTYECPYCNEDFEYSSNSEANEKAEQLLELIRIDKIPPRVELLREGESRSGGRFFNHIKGIGDLAYAVVAGIIWLMFLIIPIIWFTTLSFFIITDPGNVENWPLACFATLIPVPIMYLTIPAAIESIFNPDPLILLTTRTYFDEDEKIIFVTTEEENITQGEMSEMAIETAFELTSKHRVTVDYEPGSDGAVRPDLYSVFILDGEKEYGGALVFFGTMTSEKKSIEQARTLGNRLGIELTDPVVR